MTAFIATRVDGRTLSSGPGSIPGRGIKSFSPVTDLYVRIENGLNILFVFNRVMALD